MVAEHGGHCVGCGTRLDDTCVRFTPNALPVCGERCGAWAERWLYPDVEVESVVAWEPISQQRYEEKLSDSTAIWTEIERMMRERGLK